MSAITLSQPPLHVSHHFESTTLSYRPSLCVGHPFMSAITLSQPPLHVSHHFVSTSFLWQSLVHHLFCGNLFVCSNHLFMSTTPSGQPCNPMMLSTPSQYPLPLYVYHHFKLTSSLCQLPLSAIHPFMTTTTLCQPNFYVNHPSA